MGEEIKLPALPLAYVPACGSTQGPGRGQLVLSHVSAGTCQTQRGHASTGRPISATLPSPVKPHLGGIAQNRIQQRRCLPLRFSGFFFFFVFFTIAMVSFFALKCLKVGRFSRMLIWVWFSNRPQGRSK